MIILIEAKDPQHEWLSEVQKLYRKEELELKDLISWAFFQAKQSPQSEGVSQTLSLLP